MPKLVSIDDQRYAAFTLQSLRCTIGPLQASITSLESQESYLTAGMLPYNRNVTLQTFLSSTRDFNRLHSTFARLYNAAASLASRLRSAGSLAITENTQIMRIIWHRLRVPDTHFIGRSFLAVCQIYSLKMFVRRKICLKRAELLSALGWLWNSILETYFWNKIIWTFEGN